MMRGGSVALLLITGGIGAVAANAFAQVVPSLALQPDPEATIAERQSVSQRSRPDYDPLGIPVGSYLAFPTLQVLEAYDSNVYVTPSDEKGDAYTSIRPSLTLQSNWNEHSLNAQVSGDIIRFADQVSENVSNFSGLVGGRLDVVRDVYFVAGGGYQILHEDRSSPNAIDGEFPIEYDLTTGNLGFVHESGRLGLRLQAAIANYDYHNGITSAGLPIIETDRNMMEYGVTGRVSYEIIPGYHAFVSAGGDWRDYAQKFDAGGFQRSSQGFQVSAGTAVEIGPTLNGEIFVGYLERDYDDPRLATASGVGFGGNLLWNVTRLTSVRLSLARTVEETIVANASSYLQTLVSVGVEHELLRNLILTGTLSYANQDYQGYDRVDDVYAVDLGAQYLITRNLEAVLNLAYDKRSSNSLGIAAGAPYDRAVITGQIRLQY